MPARRHFISINTHTTLPVGAGHYGESNKDSPDPPLSPFSDVQPVVQQLHYLSYSSSRPTKLPFLLFCMKDNRTFCHSVKLFICAKATQK